MIELGDDKSHAVIGGNVIMQRDSDESVPAFRARARETALDLGSDTLIFGLIEPIVWVDDPEPRSVIARMLRDGDYPFYHYDEGE
jgi:hypothetical protein